MRNSDTLVDRALSLTILLMISLAQFASGTSAFAQTEAHFSKGFQAFKTHLYPILMNKCVQCHGSGGDEAPFADSDPAKSYSYILNFKDKYINPNDPSQSLMVRNGQKPTMAGIDPKILVSAMEQWLSEGGKEEWSLAQNALSPKVIPTLPSDRSFVTMKWDLSELDQNLNRVPFEIEIQKINGAYRLRNPKITVLGKALQIHALHVLLNGKINSMANDYEIVDGFFGVETQNGEVLSKGYQILLPEKGEKVDTLSFSFDLVKMMPMGENASSSSRLNSIPSPKQGANHVSTETISAFDESIVKKAAHFVSIQASEENPIEFEMGSPNGVGYNETLHRVKLTKSFEIQSTDVTQLQWYLVMKDQTQISSTPSNFKNENNCDSGSFPKASEHLPAMCKHHPVEQISYDDIQAFLRRLNSLSSRYQYRLPTEAEWEYIAKAGLPTEYKCGWGNDFDGAYAWYDGNSGNRTHEVALKEGVPSPQDINELIYDMAGNVWQWVQDWYGDYPSGTQTNPPGPSSGSGRVLRGGGWGDDPQFLRSAQRDVNGPGDRGGSIGFRLVRTPRIP